MTKTMLVDMLGLLNKLEWSMHVGGGHGDGGWNTCPVCEGTGYESRHRPDCQLNKQILQLEDELGIEHVSYEQQQERLKQQYAQQKLDEALKENNPYGMMTHALLKELTQGFESACVTSKERTQT